MRVIAASDDGGPHTVTTRSRSESWALVVALALCAFMVLLHLARAYAACSGDGSDCAWGHEKSGVWQGTLVDQTGRRLANTSFSVAFESVSPPIGGFSTDQHAGYCIVWALDDDIPRVTVGSREVADLEGWSPLKGRSAPRGCQDAGRSITWHRADDLESSPEFVLIALLLLTSGACLLGGLGLGRSSPAAVRLGRVGLALTPLSAGVGVLLWSS